MSTDKRYGINQHGSSVQNPDLDWSQIRETITMLALAVAQVESSMKDGEQSVSTLSASFTDMADYISQIRNLTSKVTPNNLEKYQSVIDETTANLEHNVQNAVIAFQFYDRISQRLDHVCQSLDQLGSLISEKDSLYNPECWLSLQDQIKSSYTMDAERIMFEHILRGHSIEEALEIYRHHFDTNDKGKDDQTGDEIELF
ncbi:hypothetical protein NBRC116188_00560 [Oceaniserpentilla sp. 4NH20-0058]|uniref:hypothetical protein n=1 Tax=Oceaniserpentilla sp. 4NH20-0058 TaxID=3127660 RepID=UPI00310A4DC4